MRFVNFVYGYRMFLIYKHAGSCVLNFTDMVS